MPDDRDELAVTYINDINGSLIALSYYKNNLWDFSPYIKNKNSTNFYINFNFDLNKNTNLIHENKNSLLHAAKSFIYSRWLAKSPRSGKYIKAATLTHCWSNIKPLLKWMHVNGIDTFDELTPEKCMHYAEFVITTKSIKKRKVVAQLECIELIYHLRKRLARPMQQHPWPEETAFTIANARRTNGMYDVKTELIPKRLYAVLGNKVITFLESESKRILYGWLEFHSVYDAEIELAEYQAKRRMRNGVNKKFKTLESVTYDIARARALSKTKTMLATNGFSSLVDLDKEVRFLRTCCYIIVAMFSGMRDSEIISLKTNCFERASDLDGDEYCWVHGLTYKLEDQPKPAKWMVPDIVEKAINVAAKLRKPVAQYIIKRTVKNIALVDNKAQAAKVNNDTKILENSLFLGWSALGTRPEFLQNSQSNHMLKIVSERFELLVKVEDLSEVIDRDSIIPDSLWRLTTHQFRRTFAVFVARNVLGDVRYLRHHLKHWSLDMTLYYAKDPLFDDSLFESVLSKRDELQASIISGWLAPNQNLAGGRANHIVNFRGRAEVKTAKDPQALAKAVGEGIFIRGTGHSWCLATTKGCGGEGLYEAIRCTGCGEGVIDQSHLVIWQQVRDQQIEALSWSDLGDPAWERTTRHLREAELVLAGLGHPVDPHPLPERPSHLIATVDANNDG
jgi:integrase